MNATLLRGYVLLLGLLLPITGCSYSAWKNLAAAERGDAEAQLDMGTRFARGEGVDRNDAEAAKWLRKAADQGLARAQLDIPHGRRAETCSPTTVQPLSEGDALWTAPG